jgi:hypothetical protein
MVKEKKRKLLYPDVDLPYLHDRITNVVYDLNNQPIIYHTWFAREYGDGRGDILKELTVFEDFNYSASDLPSAFLYKIGFPAKIDGESLRNIQERD